MHSDGGDTPQRVPGSPIRKPPDHSSVASSPGHIADSSVLHRLLMPRHPPCALKNLTLRKHAIANRRLQKMLASTMQFSSNRRNQPRPAGIHPHDRTGRKRGPRHPKRLFPQDPTACPAPQPPRPPFRRNSAVLAGPGRKPGLNNQCSTSELEAHEDIRLMTAPGAP